MHQGFDDAFELAVSSWDVGLSEFVYPPLELTGVTPGSGSVSIGIVHKIRRHSIP